MNISDWISISPSPQLIVELKYLIDVFSRHNNGGAMSSSPQRMRAAWLPVPAAEVQDGGGVQGRQQPRHRPQHHHQHRLQLRNQVCR